MKINKATLRYLECTLLQWALYQVILSNVITTVYTICYLHKKIFSRMIALILRQKHNFSKFHWDAAKIVLRHNSVLSKSVGS